MPIEIGIVTPSYNQGRFLEEAIDSVLSQDYRNRQYVIIDGGSTDNSVEIIRKYEKHLTFWVSEPDHGQSHAINKGLERITSDVWAYLNSDDVYAPGTFAKVASAFRDPNIKWVTGRGVYVDVNGQPVREMVPVRDWSIESVLENLIAAPIVVAAQVSNFMRRSILKEFGCFDKSLCYCMDVDFGLRFLLAGIRPMVIDEVLASARLHSESKTVSKGLDGEFARESALILKRLIYSNSADLRAIENALSGYRRHVAIGTVRQRWETSGRLSGLGAWARAAVNDPSLMAHRPALGLLRRIAFG